jgi:hypothetical protein
VDRRVDSTDQFLAQEDLEVQAKTANLQNHQEVNHLRQFTESSLRGSIRSQTGGSVERANDRNFRFSLEAAANKIRR